MGIMRLGDDGTMDTVVVCGTCGREFRYNYDDGAPPTDAQEAGKAPEDSYDEFVRWALEDASCEHIDDNGDCIADE